MNCSELVLPGVSRTITLPKTPLLVFRKTVVPCLLGISDGLLVAEVDHVWPPQHSKGFLWDFNGALSLKKTTKMGLSHVPLLPGFASVHFGVSLVLCVASNQVNGKVYKKVQLKVLFLKSRLILLSYNSKRTEPAPIVLRTFEVCSL